MTKIDFDISHLAKLARIELTVEEQTKFSAQLEHILGYVDELQKVDTDGVEETAQVTGLTNVLRDDKASEVDLKILQARRDELLAAVPEAEAGLIKVPAILGGDSEAL